LVTTKTLFTMAWLALAAVTAVAVAAQSTPAQSLLNMTPGSEKRLTPSSNQVMISRSPADQPPGIVVAIQPGKEEYPGIGLKPAGAPWNLAAFGHVEARVVNLGKRPLTLALRVDNAGDWKANPWNAESAAIAPGATATVKVIFGYSFGYKPGFPLKPSAIVNLLLFAGKSDEVQSFRLESLIAAGPAGEKPPVAPDDVRLAPANGVLLGAGVKPAAVRFVAQGAQVTPIDASGRHECQILFPASSQDASASVRPAIGRWDLRDFLAVRVAVGNAGKAPITPRARLESNGGVSEWTTANRPLAPGESVVLTVPFANPTIPDLSRPETLGGITSDAVSAVTLAADRAESDASLRVESIQAVAPSAVLPDWLGKRPPAPGDWVKTLDDEFNGAALNASLWNLYGPNYWDKTSHWSKDNVLLGNGVVRLRYQKKTGYNNDDPSQPQSDYASGYLHTYDRWTQRYGYFEARMKLPTAPGLWPAFWMMPDRGNRADPQWKRQNTADGGMEFDIMEHLTRWGPHRYNIAMHWDGYDKDHKSLGSDKIYVATDKDGYITAGLLWTPGSVVYYCNGREVLRWKNPRIASVPAILMFTLPMGGWDNSPLQDDRLPADFVIDYVRVWQRKDLVSNAVSKD
jgi:beta-glucanase (GH16 family)